VVGATTTATQRRDKHFPATVEAVFCVVGAEALKRQLETKQISASKCLSNSDRVLSDSHGKFVVLRLLMWLEDFIRV
jgi:hypothetical protein